MDKSWIFKNRLSLEYKLGVEAFLAFAKQHVEDINFISCPCVKCGNLTHDTIGRVWAHLFRYGMDKTYVKWVWHGESPGTRSPVPKKKAEKAEKAEKAQMVEDQAILDRIEKLEAIVFKGRIGSNVEHKENELPCKSGSSNSVYSKKATSEDEQKKFEGEETNVFKERNEALKDIGKDCQVIEINKEMFHAGDAGLQGKQVELRLESGGEVVAYGRVVKRPQKKRKIKESTLDPSSVPRELYMVYCYLKVTRASGKCIDIEMDEGIFVSSPLHVGFEDVEPFAQLKEISYTCIAVYLCHLIVTLKQRRINRFRILDPFNIGNTSFTSKEKNSQAMHIENRARSLLHMLRGTSNGRLCIVPGHVRFHWILTVIDLFKDEVYVLDPLYKCSNDKAWTEIVKMAIRLFKEETMTKKGSRQKPIWRPIQVPKQPNSEQCGFYILRYAKDIVEYDGPLNMNSIESLFSGRKYSRVEIDEVRVEWADFVQDYVIE